MPTTTACSNRKCRPAMLSSSQAPTWALGHRRKFRISMVLCDAGWRWRCWTLVELMWRSPSTTHTTACGCADRRGTCSRPHARWPSEGSRLRVARGCSCPSAGERRRSGCLSDAGPQGGGTAALSGAQSRTSRREQAARPGLAHRVQRTKRPQTDPGQRRRLRSCNRRGHWRPSPMSMTFAGQLGSATAAASSSAL